jgi:Tol biopolymer transport system component
MAADADGSNVVQLDRDQLVDDWESWSNDSTRLAVASRVDGKPVLRIVQADGSGMTDVPLGTVEPTEVQWRPDDRQLLIRGIRQNHPIDLYTVNLDGSNLHPLGLPSPEIFGPDWDLTGITWLPTGDRIAYNAVEPDPVTAQSEFRIHEVNADGTHDIRLPGPIGGINQAWTTLSPDGKTILAQRFALDHPEAWLVLLPADGSGPGREIGKHHANGEGADMRQMWSPDGKTILLRFSNDDFVSIDPVTGVESKVDWQVGDLPDWRRVAP